MNRFAVFFIILAVAACSHAPVVPPPVIAGEKLGSLEKGHLLEKLRAIDMSVQSFRSLYRTRIIDSNEKNSLRQAIVFSKPNRIRIESFPDNSFYTISLLIADDSGATLIDTTDHVAYQARDASSLLKRMLKIPVEASDLMSLILGHIPAQELDRLLSSSHSEVYRDPEKHEVHISLEEQEAYWLLDADSLLIKAAQYRSSSSDDVVFSMNTSGEKEESGIEIVSHVTIEMPRDEISIELDNTSLKMNSDVQDSLFLVNIPEGYSVDSL